MGDAEQVVDDLVRGRLADEAQRDAGQGDADLEDGKVVVEVGLDVLDEPGVAFPWATSSSTRDGRIRMAANSANTKKRSTAAESGDEAVDGDDHGYSCTRSPGNGERREAGRSGDQKILWAHVPQIPAGRPGPDPHDDGRQEGQRHRTAARGRRGRQL